MKALKHSALNDFKQMILGKNHPCIMARSVISSGDVICHSYENHSSPAMHTRLMEDLAEYSRRLDQRSTNQNMSFIATFPTLRIQDEAHFEQFLWKLLHDLHQQDEHDWDEAVSHDPTHSKFSFSLQGRSYYIIGMHPGSSRMARRSKDVSIVFNLHSQFERLRAMGVYDRVRDRIRKRDKQLQGSINPMLANFGDSSEALQYSGRQVDGKKWKCPYTFAKYAWERLSNKIAQAG